MEFKMKKILISLAFLFDLTWGQIETRVGPSRPFASGFVEYSDYEEVGEFGKQSVVKKDPSKLKLTASELYLPRNVIPLIYDLKITPILVALNDSELHTAPGSVDILVTCVRATDHVILHADKNSVKILDSSIFWKEEENFNPGPGKEFFLEDMGATATAIGRPSEGKRETDFYTIKFSKMLQPGFNYTIHIDFITKISTTELKGLYLSTYTHPQSGDKKSLVVTQFEDISARQMWPCFDEPDLKAVFRVTIGRKAGYNSLSNMPISKTEKDSQNEGYFLDHFEPTPAMSTYLVALVVSDFTCSTAPKYLYPKDVQACGPSHMVEKGGADHAARVSAKILACYEKIWKVPYPLPKMHSVAIPDFAAGAMENYGLNTYRVKALMYFPGTSTERERMSIENVIAHELGHQNFGDLVTTKKWNHIFLNEGFATYVSQLGHDCVSPEFGKKDWAWYTDYFQVALRADASPKTHPLVKTEDYFGDFDTITYSKGASVIKMMEHLLSEEGLIGGLREYLHKYSFSNVEYHDLLETLDSHAKVQGGSQSLETNGGLKKIMQEWITNPGFPLVKVKLSNSSLSSSSSDHVLGSDVEFSQERFIKRQLLKGKSEPSPDENLHFWHLPIFMTTSTDKSKNHSTTPFTWLTPERSLSTEPLNSEAVWVIVNPEAKAFARVQYDETLYKALLNELRVNPKAFSAITRAQLVDDAFELAWAGYGRIGVGLDTTKDLLLTEHDPVVWSTALTHLKTISVLLQDDAETTKNFHSYLSPRVDQALKAVGVSPKDDDKGAIVLHRTLLFSWGMKLRLPSVLEYTWKVFNNLNVTGSVQRVPADMRAGVLCSACCEDLHNASQSILNEYSSPGQNETSMRSLLLHSLACSRNPAFVTRLLQNSLKMKCKRSAQVLLNLLLSSPHYSNRRTVFSYISDHLVTLVAHFGGVETVLKIFEQPASGWNTKDGLDQIKAFREKYPKEVEPVADKIDGILAHIEENMAQVAFFKKDLTTWINEAVNSS